MMKPTVIACSTRARAIVLARLRTFMRKSAVASVMLLALTAVTTRLFAASPSMISTLGLVVADFNRDGIPDVLSPSNSSNALTISFGAKPNGTFSAVAKNVPYPALCANLNTNAVVTGDFNGDGYPDLAMSCYGGQISGSAIFILLGNGDGTFTAGAQLVGQANIVLGDFNHDNRLDIVTTGNGGNFQTVTFYEGKGDGTFNTGVTTNLSRNFYTAALAVDVNQDGLTDLVMNYFSGSSTSSVDIFKSNGDGTFGTSVPTAGVYNPSASIAVGTAPSASDQSTFSGNFFGTGLPDLGVVDTGTAPGIYIARNTSTSTTISFATPAKTAVASLSSAQAANFIAASPAGLTDLLIYNGSSLKVLANNGSGGFNASYAGLTVSASSLLYATADANGDGHADIYVGSTTSTGTTFAVSLVSGPANASSTAFTLPAGTFPVSATWPGNINFSGSTATGSQVVSAVGTTLALSSSKNPSFVGDSVTFIATVTPSASGTFVAGGTVTFTDGSTNLGTGTLTAGGTAALTTTSLAAGSHTIRAAYSGDTVFAGSSTTLVQAVNANTPVITWATPAAITYGTPLSATQLNATAANTTGTPIPGTFVYTPAAGTVLNAGTQTLTVLFTPTDTVTYTTATKSVQIVVNPAAPTITFAPAVATIPYGTPLGASQLNAVATGIGGVTVPGTFVYTPPAGTVLSVGTQTLGVVFTPSNTNYTIRSSGAQIIVTQATPTLAWATPAPIAYGVSLSGTQLNATAAGVGGATLPGTFVYTPPAGTVLSPGTQTLSVVFTPTDVINYTTASTNVKLLVTDLVFTSLTPNTAIIGDANKTITIIGSGFVASTVAQIGTTALVTTLVNATTLTAVVPASSFLVAGTLQISLKSPATGTTSQSLSLTVTAPVPAVTVTAPSTAAPGTQPAVTLAVTNPYPVPLTATFTLTNAPAGTPAVDDPAVQFASGGRTYSFTIPAGSTTVPNVQIQTGTVAGTISVTLVLTVNGVVVTPPSVASPSVIVIPAAVPSVTAAALTRTGQVLTVTVAGFSNDREIVQANFHFVAAPSYSISTPDVTAPVSAAFATWFASQQSLQYGSTFHYAQDFNVSDDASHIGSVVVTLTNKLGVSSSQTAQ